MTLCQQEIVQEKDFFDAWQAINDKYDKTNFNRYLKYSKRARSLPVSSNKIIFIGDSHADFLSRRLFY